MRDLHLLTIVVSVAGSGVDDKHEKVAKVIVNDCYYQNIKKTSTWSYDTGTKEYVINGKTYAIDKVKKLIHTPTLKSPKLTLYEARLKPKVQKNQYETIANAIEDVNGQMKFKINSVTNSANSEDDVEKFIKEWSNELAPLGLARIEKIDKYGYSNFYCSIDIKTPEDLISLTNAVGQIIVESYDDDPWITIYDDYMN